MLLIDVDHFEEVKAHQDRLRDQETVCFSLLVSISVFSSKLFLQSDHGPDSDAEAIFVLCTVEPGVASVPNPKSQVTPSQVKTCPKPHPIFGKKRKILEDSQMTVQKHTRSDNISGPHHTATSVEDIHKALIAQHEPQPNDIDDLRMYSLTSGSVVLTILIVISLHSFTSDPILVVS
jgi:hypothetical protein